MKAILSFINKLITTEWEDMTPCEIENFIPDKRPMCNGQCEQCVYQQLKLLEKTPKTIDNQK